MAASCWGGGLFSLKNMKKSIYLFGLLAVACSPQNDSTETSTNDALEGNVGYPSELQIESLNELEVMEDALNFYVIGDWGRNGYFHQKDLAETMNQAAFVIEPEFVISTGDNFYDNGVASVDDPQWETSFENIYTGNFLQVPWYVVLGNHDYRTNPQAEIDYSNKSARWTMPSRYWFTDMNLEEEGDVRFLFLDTSPCEDEYYSEEKYRNVWSQDSTKQLEWMDSVLSVTTQDWRIAIGHHPLYTGGKRANDPAYVRSHVERYFDEYTVHAYFCGHEHDLQHIKPENHPTHHFVSGAGAEVRPTGEIEGTHFAQSQTGFMIVSLTKDIMLVQAVNWKGEVLYATKIERAE